MKRLVEIFFKQLHWIIIIYTGWTIYGNFMEHQKRKQDELNRVPGFLSQIKKYEKKLRVAEEFRKNLDESKKRIENISLQIEDVQKRLPNKISDPEILDFFSTEAEALNIKNVFLTPVKEEVNGFYISKKYEFKAEGTYLQFLVFFDRISQADRLYNIARLDLAPSDKKQKGRFQLIKLSTHLEAFRYNPTHKEETGLDELEENIGGSKGRTAKKTR